MYANNRVRQIILSHDILVRRRDLLHIKLLDAKRNEIEKKKDKTIHVRELTHTHTHTRTHKYIHIAYRNHVIFSVFLGEKKVLGVRNDPSREH